MKKHCSSPLRNVYLQGASHKFKTWDYNMREINWEPMMSIVEEQHMESRFVETVRD